MEEERRVQTFLQEAGLCSRRKAEELIEKDKVKVNGRLAYLGQKCTKKDRIEVQGKVLSFRKEKQHLYLVMNKKKNLTCSNSDELGRKTVFDVLPSKYKNKGLFSVGRLDRDTTGLLLLTNDGQFNQQIIHPSSKIHKVYLATLSREITESEKRILENGISLDGYKLKPSQIKKISDKRYRVSISEGRKNQIKRMFNSIDVRVTTLKRIQIGGLDLKGIMLKPGEVKAMKKEDLLKFIFVK